MANSFINPYSGTEEESCSVSFAAQHAVAGSTGSAQTEAQYYKSKLLGEWGVIMGKVSQGLIPNGTKVLTYSNPNTKSRGYLFVKGNAFYQKNYDSSGKGGIEKKVDGSLGPYFINGGILDTAIPQAVSAKPKPELVPIDPTYADMVGSDPVIYAKNEKPVAVNAAGDYIVYQADLDTFTILTTDTNSKYGYVTKTSNFSFKDLMKEAGGEWYKPDNKAGTPNATPAKKTPPPAPSQVAAPVATPPVNPGSTSVGSMSDEDVSAMFVKIKDDLAKEQGLNIKGANAQLDAVVYKAIGDKTGYTADEVKAKIDAYKAAGNKLSALKKKVMAGTKKVPEGKPQPTKASPAAPLNTPKATSIPVVDPKPNAVPTVATPKLADAIKADVKATVNDAPSKVYTDEDIAAQYIMRKDEIVASNTKGWTLYTKNDEFDKAIYDAIAAKTGVGELAAKQHIAAYLGIGKKLSVLKKQLVKQGAFTKKADSLKKSGTDKTLDEKAKEVNEKADAGYTPTPTPATGTPKVDTGKPAPKKVAKEAQGSGDISGISTPGKALIYKLFKDQGTKSYLSSSEGQIYEGLLLTQQQYEVSTGTKYTLLQLLRVIDEQGAIKFNAENAKLFEKKMATWLTTPAAAKYLKDKEVQIAKAAEAAKAKLEAIKQAKKMEAQQPPLPADSALYRPWELEKAKRISKTWLDAKPWSSRERRDLTHYTGSAYGEMNGYLRGGESGHISERSRAAIDGARDGMRPTTEPILVQRGTGLGQFSSLGIQGYGGDDFLMWSITGKTFKDEGFLSTSAGGRAAFGGAARLEIECPVGTPMAYVAPISNFPHENEMLLQAGMEYKVLNVRRDGNTWVVRMRVVNWPGKGK